MKQFPDNITFELEGVAPRVGAWIETCSAFFSASLWIVAPRVGAWIETVQILHTPPSSYVAPRVGAWIGNTEQNKITDEIERRPPRGGGD